MKKLLFVLLIVLAAACCKPKELYYTTTLTYDDTLTYYLELHTDTSGVVNVYNSDGELFHVYVANDVVINYVMQNINNRENE